MDAHKRIWAWPHFDGWITGDWSANTYHDDRTVEYILATEHDRIVAEKDAEIARLVSERQRVDRRIKNQRAQLAWWNKLFHERLAAACRRRIYYPNWTPVLYRRAKARRAIKGDDNLREARRK